MGLCGALDEEALLSGEETIPGVCSEAAGSKAVRVVLGGGGAKGIVHIGVLKAIDHQGLRIASIVGTSIGAIWAALYANIAAIDSQRRSIEMLEKLALRLRFKDYQDLQLLKAFTKGPLKGEKLEYQLETWLWNRELRAPLTFRDLKFDLTVTVTDAATGDPVICNARLTPDVSVARAVRGSMSIQGLFQEVSLEIPEPDGTTRSVRCWDGGATGNCRFEIAYQQAPQLPVIASSLTYRGDPVDVNQGYLRRLGRVIRIGNHTIDALLRQQERVLLENLGEARERVLLLRPPLSGISTLDLNLSNFQKTKAIALAQSHSAAKIREYLEKRSGK